MFSKNIPLVKADLSLIDRALQNLLDNAIKFCRDGDIISIEINTKKPGEVELRISNSGAGISQVSDGFTYPSVDQTIKVTLSNDDGSTFTLRIDNLPGSTTPIAPGVWAVHSMGSMVLFTDNMSDYGDGLEGLAEDGDPTTLLASLGSQSDVISSGVFNTPTGSSGPGPLFPGSKYEFTFTAEAGQSLSFATMFVQSNDLFFAIGSQSGIELWNNDTPFSGDISSTLILWDAGTEVNDGFTYPSVSDVIFFMAPRFYQRGSCESWYDSISSRRKRMQMTECISVPGLYLM